MVGVTSWCRYGYKFDEEKSKKIIKKYSDKNGYSIDPRYEFFSSVSSEVFDERIKIEIEYNDNKKDKCVYVVLSNKGFGDSCFHDVGSFTKDKFIITDEEEDLLKDELKKIGLLNKRCKYDNVSRWYSYKELMF